jgi:hypothetical protein
MLLFKTKKFNLFKQLWLYLLIVFSSHTFAASEYELKAAFLYNLSNFVTWPPAAFPSDDLPFMLCILGKDYFNDALDVVTANQKVAGHSIQVMKLTNEAEARNCQLVFISNSEQSKMAKILNILKPYPILTVGDTDDFIEQGGMVMFMNTSEGKVKLAINPENILEAHLKASAKLLQIAKIIK